LKIRFLLFLICYFFLSCSSPTVDYSHIKVIEVIDGDTLILEGGAPLRLIGIDTPEIRKKTASGFIYEPAPFSLESKQYVQELAGGRFVRIEFDVEKKDKYGRILGYCFVKQDGGEVFLNKKLLEAGFAVLYTYPPNVKHVEEFVKAQKQARRNRAGLWGTFEAVPADQAEGLQDRLHCSNI